MAYIASFAILALSATGSRELKNDYSNPAKLFELIQTQNEPYLLIDIRYLIKYNKGHIPTAVNISLSEIKTTSPKVDKDMLIIVYCTHCEESKEAKAILEEYGFSHVVDFGEVLSWPYNLAI